jgi:hypothetical protein
MNIQALDGATKKDIGGLVTFLDETGVVIGNAIIAVGGSDVDTTATHWQVTAPGYYMYGFYTDPTHNSYVVHLDKVASTAGYYFVGAIVAAVLYKLFNHAR